MQKIKPRLDTLPFLKNRRTINLALLCVSVLAFAVVIACSAAIVTDKQDAAAISVPLCLLFFVTVFFAAGKKAFDLPVDRFLAILIFSGFAILIRYIFLSWRSSDYAICLEHWLSHVREMPGTASLSQKIGDYNAPYFYILFCIGKLTNISFEMFYTKFASILFDLVAAYYIMRLVSIKDSRGFVRLGAFFTVLLLPTVILNSSVWTQCDSIYAAFSLGGLYYGIMRRGKLSLLFFALALSFKLQTIFILPIIIVFLMLGNIRWKDLWVFPAAFFAVLLPAVLAGRGIIDTLSVYFNQTTAYSAATLRCPNLFGLLGMTDLGPSVEYAFILITGFGCLAFLYFLYYFRKNLNAELVGLSAFVFVLIIPYTLPHMHERYFYLADLLSVLYGFWFCKRWYIPVVVVTSSFLCYLPFLFGNDYTTPFGLPLLSLAILIIIGIVIKYTLSGIASPRTEISNFKDSKQDQIL
jgi:Gpi18-like mannosyltransferase